MEAKQKYLDAAMDLFSRYGYNGVSVRDIAKETGTRESALYKHYKNKNDLMESIIETAEEKLSEFRNTVNIDNHSMKNTLIEFYLNLFEFYCENVFMNKFRRIMIISQYESIENKKRYNEMFLTKSLRYYEDVFAKIISDKKIEKVDAKFMSYELYSVLFTLMQEYDSDNNEYEYPKSLLKLHIENFFAKYDFLEEL